MDTQGKAMKSVNSKLAISKSSSSSTKSVSVTMRSMSKSLKESSQMSHLIKYVEKNLHSPSYASKSDADKSLMSSPCSVSSYSFTINVAPVMIEADNVDASHIMGKQVEAHDEVEAPAKQHYTEKDKYAKELQISSDGLIPVDQLKEFIEGTIRRKIEESSKLSLTYSKPYTPRIDNLKMPMDYQLLQFQQFDVKQFVRSLKSNAFDWYTDLEAGSIDGWEQLEQEFLNRFYSTRRTISMVELTNSCQ
ncbi:UNVERIFIED_CONTAM: hypothetical protein Scaly_1172500 [Sesamum calycinum]|uniref:Retrotransposon gag domain-containing protein n=1 Tax=Sesamum calycinum TaxID=2727403 RepID=A0AAW2Q340_9LAMI